MRGGVRTKKTNKQTKNEPSDSESKVQMAVINHSLSTRTLLRVSSNESGSSNKEKGGQIRDNLRSKRGGGRVACPAQSSR